MPSNDDAPPRRTPANFMVYPRPDAERVLAHLDRLPVVTSETRACIAKLLAYRAVRTETRLPRGASAAVLVPLFVGRTGDLYVLLSRRSDKLSSFAGDTALPGGKVDAGDATVEDTARREAFEEVGLPRDERVPLLCVMEPHLAKGVMLVTPVVVLILDHTLQPNLNASEVTSIFAQPLVSFLSSTSHLSPSRMADPSVPYHTFTDFALRNGDKVRLHSFLTGRESEGIKPVFGLTSSILIKTATIGYGRLPDFELQPPNAPTQAQQIAYAFLTMTNPIRIACEREGIDANKAAARFLSPPVWANATGGRWRKMWIEWKKRMEQRGGGNGENPELDPRKEGMHDDAECGIPYRTQTGAQAQGGVEERIENVENEDDEKLVRTRKTYAKVMERMKAAQDETKECVGKDGNEQDPEQEKKIPEKRDAKL